MFNDRRKKAAAYRDGAVARKGLGRDHESYTVSENVKVVRPAGKDFLTHNPTDAKGLDKGAVQARVQNARSSATPSKSEAKATARGLKAAQGGRKISDKKAMKTGRAQGAKERDAVREEVKKSGSWDTRAERYSNAASLVESRKKNNANLYDGGKK